MAGFQTFTNIEQAAAVFVFFIVKVVIFSGTTTTDAKDVKQLLGFRLMSMRIIGVSFGDSTPGEGVLLQVESIYQPKGLEVRPEWRRGAALVKPFNRH